MIFGPLLLPFVVMKAGTERESMHLHSNKYISNFVLFYGDGLIAFEQIKSTTSIFDILLEHCELCCTANLFYFMKNSGHK